MREAKSGNQIADLLGQIEEGSTSTNVPLTEILRLCMRLGNQLGNKELVAWARMEASGYSEASELPDYRKLPTESRGDFYGPFGSGLKNAHIPNAAIEKDHREVLCNVYLFEPVAELEALATTREGNDGLLRLPWSGNLIAYYQQKELHSNGLRLATAWRIMSKQKLTGVIETIRTRVLDFVLKIKEELGILGDSTGSDSGASFEPPEPAKVQQIFYNTVYGGNIAQGNNGSLHQNTINVQAGDLDSLDKYLRGLGFKDHDLNELKLAVVADEKQKEKPGPAVSRWLAKAMQMGLKGGLSVTSNAAGSLIAGAIMKYYKIA